MGFLIDSNILIAAERGKFSLTDFGQSLQSESLGIAALQLVNFYTPSIVLKTQ